MGRKDYILIIVLYGSLISGVFFPHISEKISPYIKYLLLAGVSTGVSSPFFTSLCKGNISYCLVMAIVSSLIVLLAGIGWLFERRRHWPDKMASSGSQVWLNNVVIIALAIQIDQPLAATLGAFYFIPLYGFVIFYSVLSKRNALPILTQGA